MNFFDTFTRSRYERDGRKPTNMDSACEIEFYSFRYQTPYHHTAVLVNVNAIISASLVTLKEEGILSGSCIAWSVVKSHRHLAKRENLLRRTLVSAGVLVQVQLVILL